MPEKRKFPVGAEPFFMKKILVPLDGSALAEQALPVAAAMLEPEVEIILVRVISPISLTDADLTRDEALDYLSATKEELIRQHPEASVQTRLLQGTIADTIIDFAEDEDIGLIITTTLGSSGFRRWLMGSTAEKIVRYAPCPVLSIGRKSLKKHAQD